MPIIKPMTVISGGKERCGLTFDTDKKIPPASSRERVTNEMIMLKTASLQDLVHMTRLPEEAILSEIKWLRKEFDLRGNRRIGYTLSPDVLKRVAMCDSFHKMFGARTSPFS